MFTIKRLRDCTLQEACEAWNTGFQGYFFDATTTVEAFTSRLGWEGLSPSMSVVAFADDKPIGLVLSGVRTIGGKKVAWNGGTGVDPSYRRTGAGRALMEAALEIYKEEQVNSATLEAISQNERAIALYQKLGYNVIDKLLFFNRETAFESDPFPLAEGHTFQLRHGIAQDIKALPFYQKMSPWQIQWESAQNGCESITVFDQSTPVGYALFEKKLDEAGNITKINLLHCEADPKRDDTLQIMSVLLQNAFAPLEQSFVRGTFNFRESNQAAVQLLQQAGFEIKISQVQMKKQM